MAPYICRVSINQSKDYEGLDSCPVRWTSCHRGWRWCGHAVASVRRRLAGQPLSEPRHTLVDGGRDGGDSGVARPAKPALWLPGTVASLAAFVGLAMYL